MESLLLPVVDEDGAPFWEYAARGELRVQACAAPDCGRLRFPPRPCCPHCRSFESEWRAMSGRGRIWSYVVPHPPLLPAYAAQAPYNAVVVELADAPHIRLVGNVVSGPDAPLNSVDPGRLRIGASVKAVFAPVSPELTAVRWQLER
ncbi:Zn-ribbon domain-containing OB-fold protein [Streptomyces sp. NPDC005134]|uniref:Zn-ribbon domain-containing OB-fold protein n=1 Tax=unclassified Streptomyces TaxID=2593676 RepID=UPI0033B8B4AE